MLWLSDMSRRRIVTAGKVTGNDRRTTRRFHLFTPDEEGMMEEIFWYCLALAASENNIAVYAATLMSSHPHYDVEDRDGRLPLFKRDFHRWLSLSTKAFRDWPEEVFNKSAPGEHEVLTPEALVHDLAYLIANPVSAGAVRSAARWPGAKTLPQDIGVRVIRARRPPFWFKADNDRWPDEVELVLEMPRMLLDEYGSLEAAQRAIADEVEVLEKEAHRKLCAKGQPFEGRRRVLRRKHTDMSKSPEQRGRLNPQHAAGGNRTAAANAIAARREFNRAYDEALSRWTSGDRDVVFPHGTWWMRVHHGVRCGPPT